VRALPARYPGLARTLAWADLGVRETPVEWWRLDGATLLAKRDDLSARTLGGNKVRALELLLAGVAPGDTILTVGPTGSTHALAVAAHGADLGARTQVITWPQEGHAVAHATSRRLGELARVTAARSVAEAYLRAATRRLRGGVHWVPAGGSVPLGALGHVDAALELADQLASTRLPRPDLLVVPLGSGGTVAGLLVGLALAGLPTRVVGVRVVPRIVANRGRVLGLATRTHASRGSRASACPRSTPERWRSRRRTTAVPMRARPAPDAPRRRRSPTPEARGSTGRTAPRRSASRSRAHAERLTSASSSG
jgi:D-cysteine desulfhydrase